MTGLPTDDAGWLLLRMRIETWWLSDLGGDANEVVAVLAAVAHGHVECMPALRVADDCRACEDYDWQNIDVCDCQYEDFALQLTSSGSEVLGHYLQRTMRQLLGAT